MSSTWKRVISCGTATDERGPTAPALVEKGSRFLLALMVAVFGANKFLGFLKMPPPRCS